jgi:hypothetical protein
MSPAVGSPLTLDAERVGDANFAAAKAFRPAISSRSMAWSEIDIVRLVPIVVGFIENCASVIGQVDPRDRKPIFLGVAPKIKSDRIADRDVGRQPDVVVGLAGGGNEPIAAFGQHTRAVW